MNPLKVAVISSLLIATTGTGGWFIYKDISSETIRQRLASENISPLSTSEESTDDSALDSKWKEIVQKYSSPNNVEISTFAGWTTEDNNQEQEKIKKLKAKCQKLLDEQVTEKGLDEAKKYCVN